VVASVPMPFHAANGGADASRQELVHSTWAPADALSPDEILKAVATDAGGHRLAPR